MFFIFEGPILRISSECDTSLTTSPTSSTDVTAGSDVPITSISLNSPNCIKFITELSSGCSSSPVLNTFASMDNSVPSRRVVSIAIIKLI